MKRSNHLKTKNEVRTDGLPNPTVISDLCLPVLRLQLANEQLGFKPEPRSRTVSSYRLVGSGQQFATARETYPVHLFRTGNRSALYWAAVALDFRYTDPKYELVNVQIILFSGDARQQKVPMLRAEWHCSTEILEAPNAQPHWHVYTEPWPEADLGFAGRVVTNFARATEQHDTVTENYRGVPFHFAMSAQWHRMGDDAHRIKVSDAQSLIKWLSGCLTYIRGQLQE